LASANYPYNKIVNNILQERVDWRRSRLELSSLGTTREREEKWTPEVKTAAIRVAVCGRESQRFFAVSRGRYHPLTKIFVQSQRGDCRRTEEQKGVCVPSTASATRPTLKKTSSPKHITNKVSIRRAKWGVALFL